MFVIGASYISLLQAVAARCSLPYAATVCEAASDGTMLYGIELELPPMVASFGSQRMFFWSAALTNPAAAYDQAAFQAICYLQSLYGFVVMDYSFQGLLLYQKIAQAALSIAVATATFPRL
ncbi:unnamed protein product [Urochloa humidicola]